MMLPKPTSSPTGKATAVLGANGQERRCATPKASAPRPTTRMSITVRRALTSAPTSDADADHREEQGEGALAAAEVAGDEERDHDLEVEGQRADDGHHHERHPQLGRLRA